MANYPIEFPRTPVVPGADYTVHDVSVQAIVTCRCAPGGRVLVIRDHRLVTVCPGCQRQYLIGEVQYDVQAGGIAAKVGFREPTIVVPTSEVR